MVKNKKEIELGVEGWDGFLAKEIITPSARLVEPGFATPLRGYPGPPGGLAGAGSTAYLELEVE